METPTETEYDNSHRAFLQAFLARGSMTFAQARPILAAAMTATSPDDRETLPNDITEADLNNYIATINGIISPFDLEFRSTIAQTPRQQQQNGDRPTMTRIYALVNTTSDAITQLATTHSPDEIAFVKRVLDEMFINGCTRRQELYAVPAIKAVNCNTAPSSSSSSRNRQSGSGVNGNNYNHNHNSDNDNDQQQQQSTTVGQIQSITKHQAESLLDTLVTEGWFECSRRKFYTLAPRALMELRGWLTETYNDDDDDDDEDDDNGEDEDNNIQQRIKFCAACRDIVTIGQRCPDLNCKGRLHEHCTMTMWRSQGGVEKCPVCKKRWEGFGFVGEKVVTSSSRVSNVGVGTAGPRRRVEDAVVEEDEDDGEDEEEDE